MRSNLPEEDIGYLKKRNRIKKLSPKLHQISHESGRATKNLWARIIERASLANSSRRAGKK